jgi:hypothetical protein
VPGLLLAAASSATLIGPTPYTGFAGSPFDGTVFSSFFLEDFEDGALNTLGASASAGGTLPPAPLTDSVDPGGWSYYSLGATVLTFSFNPVALGGYPTHAGIVWTDVGFLLSDGATPSGGPADVIFEAFDAGSVSLGTIGPVGLGDDFFTGTTGEDRFFGVTNAGGISAIRITMPDSNDWEVDHLQYGTDPSLIPEPATAALLGLGLALVAGLRRGARR